MGYPIGSSKAVKDRVDEVFALAILLVSSREFVESNGGILVGLTVS